jgi:hypothetical protein
MKQRTADRRATDSQKRALTREIDTVVTGQATRLKGMYGLMQQHGISPGDLSRNPAMLSSTPFVSGPKAFALWQDFKRQLSDQGSASRPTDRERVRQQVRAMRLRRLDQLTGI